MNPTLLFYKFMAPFSLIVVTCVYVCVPKYIHKTYSACYNVNCVYVFRADHFALDNQWCPLPSLGKTVSLISAILSCLKFCLVLSCLVLPCLVLSCLVLSCLGVVTSWDFPPFHFITSFGVSFVHVLFVQPCRWDFMRVTSDISRGQNLTINSLFLWPLLWLLFHKDPWAFGAGFVS